MNVISPYVEVIDCADGEQMLKTIELCGRVCYKSEDKITNDSSHRFVRQVLKSGHESVLEHAKITVRVVCDRGVSHEIVRHRLASYSQESSRYCVAGDTCLTNKRGKVAVSDIFQNIQHSKNGAYKKMKFRQLNEDTGEVIYSKINNVYHNGIREVFEIKTALGYSLQCTSDHEIYTPSGYKKLSELNVNDVIYVNGVEVDMNTPYKNFDWIYYQSITLNKTFKAISEEFGYNISTIKKWAYRLGIPKKGTGYFKQGNIPWNKGLKETDDIRVKKQGDTLRKYHCNGRHDNEFMLLKEDTVNYQKHNKGFCEICHQTNDIEVHHKDKNRNNNDPTNLISLCSSCHKRVHNQSLLIACSDTITSITAVGFKDVYDVEMNSKYHNFIANGVVVHNCTYGGGATFIKPCFWEDDSMQMAMWRRAMEHAEKVYCDMLKSGATPEQARSVLPNSLKTEIVMTMNLREWRHFFRMRLSHRAHPQMREVSNMIYTELKNRVPIVFDDIAIQET